MTRRTGAVQRFRRARCATGRIGCDACGWTAPERLRLKMENDVALMHAHHVIPVICGGPDDESNLILLCRNCHAIAHAIGDGRYGHDGKWSGPASTPEQLIQVIELTWRPLPISLPEPTANLNTRHLSLCPE